MKTVLVTGGAGFIGSHLVDRLIDEGYQVVVVDDLSRGKLTNINKKADFNKLDIRESKFENLVKKLKPAFIFHFAAQSSIESALDNPEAHIKINLITTQKILELAKKAGTEKLIFASSAAVYSDTNDLPIEEDHPKEPISFYGVTKLCSEYLFQIHYRRFHFPYVCLRFSNIYGERQDSSAEGGVVAIFIRRMLKGEKVIIYGDGEQTRDFLYVSDAVSACIETLSPKVVGEFNISTGKATSVKQLYENILEISKTKISFEFQKLRQIEVKNSSLSPEKFIKTTPWNPEADLKNGLIKTFNYFKAQR